MLKMYATAKYVFSGRLHGAIPAFGMGGRKVVHIGVDTRMSAVDYFDGISNIEIQHLTPDIALASMRDAEPWDGAKFHEEFWNNQVLFYRERIAKEGLFQ
jgi:hypothetical protein